MMVVQMFSSGLAELLDGFLERKHATGFKYGSQKYLLKNIDKYCSEHFHQATELSQELVMKWVQRRDCESISNLKTRMALIRELAKYLNSIGINAYIMPDTALPKKDNRFVPHIFTDEELRAFFASVDCCEYHRQSPARHLVVPIVFRALYCCGLRTSEVLGLAVKDVDLITGKITIRQAKNNRDRNVMFSEDVLDLCRRYDKMVSCIFMERTHFFPNNHGHRYQRSFMCQVFHEFWDKARIGTTSGNKPTVHCFRHTFAVKRLNLWVQEGKNLNAYLPYLSMYMGHVHFSDTDYYLHLVPEFFSFMTAKIDEGYSHFIPEVNT